MTVNNRAIELLSTVFPNSRTQLDNLDNPDVVLVQAPAWGVETPPLSLASLAAYLRKQGRKTLALDLNIELYKIRPKEYEITWDLDQSQWFWESNDCVNKLMEDFEKQISDTVDLIIATNTPLVGFTLYSSSAFFTKRIIKILKERKPTIKIVVGGPHASHHMAGNEFALDPLVDAAAQGEGEETLDEVIQCVKKNEPLYNCKGLLISKDGKVFNTGTRPLIRDIDDLPIPDFSDFSFDVYDSSNKLPMASSRGCPNKCIYCNEQPYWERYRFRSAESMINELKIQMSLYPSINHIDFQDSLCNGKVSALEQFADGIVENEIQVSWSGQAVIRKEMTLELMNKLRRSGCAGLAYGLETPNQTLMQYVGKLLSKGADINKIAEAHGNSGLGVVYNVMFGLPGETEEDALQVLEFVRRNQKHNIVVNPSAAFCGFSSGTPGWDNPEKFNIDKTNGGLFWSSTDGTNTYLTRLKRFEDFCKLVSDLNVKTTYPATHLLNRNQMIAKYYITIGKPDQAIYYYKEWIKDYPEDKEAQDFLKKYPDVNQEDDFDDHVYYLTNYSDDNWVRGIATQWATAFFLPLTPSAKENFKVGRKVKFCNGDVRIIIGTEASMEYKTLTVKLEGERLDGKEVGWPNSVTLLKEQRIIPIISAL